MNILYTHAHLNENPLRASMYSEKIIIIIKNIKIIFDEVKGCALE